MMKNKRSYNSFDGIFLENRYGEKIYLTKIAEEFGVSTSYLSSAYSSATHQSFKDALFSVRMKKAKELI